MTVALRVASAVFLVAALFGKRWAYVGFMLSSLMYFPAQAGFQLDPRQCEMLVPLDLAMYSFRNYAHEVLFTVFLIVSAIHFSHGSKSRRLALTKAVIGSLAYGVIIEIGEGISGHGHCRLRDLLPDSAGILAGLLIVMTWNAIRPAPEREA